MTSTPKTTTEGSNPNVNDGGIKTFRYSQGFIEAPSLNSQALKSRSEFKPSTSADDQISNSFFGPMDFGPPSLDSFPDSGINDQTPTPNSEASSSQKRYISPLSTHSTTSAPAPGEVPSQTVLEHSPLRNEVTFQTEHEPLIPHRPAPIPPPQPPNLSTAKPKRFKRIRKFFSNFDEKYEAFISRHQIKGLVKGKDEEEGEMEETRREVEKARKTQKELIYRKKKSERKKKKKLTASGKIGWKSTLQRKFRNLSLSFPWNKNKKKTQQEQIEKEKEERENASQRRYQRAEARRAMREQERDGVLGRQVHENQRPFEDMEAARRESRFRETIREVGSESESEEFYDEDEDVDYSSDEEEIAGRVGGMPLDYYRYRHTVA
jgi:hypothetical protein